MSENVNINIDAELQNAALTDKETGERMFTQSQLEEIISERLQRERRVNESLRTVKQVLASISKSGLVGSGSYAEMAKELIGKLKALDEQKATSGKEEETADDNENEPSLTKDPEENGIGGEEHVSIDGKDETAVKEAENTGEEQEEKEDFVSVLGYLKTSYSDSQLEKLLSGDLFEKFAKGRSGSAREILSDFFDFASALSQNHESETVAGYSDHGSTAFSSQSGTGVFDGGLTPRQMEIARNAGMSYREYYHLLESIPKRTKRIF